LSILSKDALDKWRKRIGQEKAEKISECASNRGTDLHSVLEAYLKNETVSFPEDPKSRVRIMFNRMKRVLSKVDNIVAQEIALYSDELKVAGRCDCIAEYDGVLSVVDFKGATKAKKKDWIKSYFLQTTGYSLMLEERTGMKAEQIVIFMAGEEDFSVKIFVEDRNKYINQLKETIDLFASKQ
jgi:genome maintenance exonuclease 1